MKKLNFAAIAVSIALLAGCSDNAEVGGTGLEQSSAPCSAASGTDTASAESDSGTSSASMPKEKQDPGETREDTAQVGSSEAGSSSEAPDINAAELISAYDNEFLGLPSADKVYIFSNGGDTAEIGGETFYSVGCYDDYEGTLYYMCDFYINAAGSDVYRWYAGEERFARLPEYEGFVRLDPETQTPEEMFAAADSLYTLFSPIRGEIETDPSVTTEYANSTYELVTDKRLDTKAKLLKALSRYFDTAISNALMDTNRFIEQDGALYYLNIGSTPSTAYRGSVYALAEDTSESTEHAETLETGEAEDNIFVYTEFASYEYEAGETEVEERTYVLKKEFGIWRFTSYPYKR